MASSNLKHPLIPIPIPIPILFSAAHAAQWDTAESRRRPEVMAHVHEGVTASAAVADSWAFVDKSRFDTFGGLRARKAWRWDLLESFESEYADALQEERGEPSESPMSDGSVEPAESVGQTVPSNQHQHQTNSHRTRPRSDSGKSVASSECRRKKLNSSSVYGPNSRAVMAVRTYTWITLWFIVTAPVIFWDASYCFMRPRSMVGGDLHWIWEPYGLYQEIDYVYGLKALQENNGFTNAQSLLNLVETAMNLAYVFLAHISNWPGAPIVGFAAATMTLSKTVLYWANEYYCSGCSIGHNDWPTLLIYWVIPNGLWLVFPSLIVYRLGKDIIGDLFVASNTSVKAVSGKTE